MLQERDDCSWFRQRFTVLVSPPLWQIRPGNGMVWQGDNAQLLMGKLEGGRGIWLDICGCAVIKIQTHYMVIAETLPFSLCATLSQHSLNLLFNLASFPLHPLLLHFCPIVSICPHFYFRKSPVWFHAKTLHSSCSTLALLSFSGLHALLSKSIFTLRSFTCCS